MQKDFVHLHVHTEYSLLDGACRITELISRVKELGQKAVAITDHGVVSGAVQFYKEAKSQGIKPIIGCEVYVAPRTRFDKIHKIDNQPHHLVLLCKNEAGYKNLIYMVSQGYIEGMYFKPRIDRELLSAHSEGLIALSGCLSGEIPRLLMEGNYEKAKETAEYYKGLFGEENYYIEIQNHGIPEQARIMSNLVKLSRDAGVPLVATNDAHYTCKSDSYMQKILICIQTNSTINEESDLEFSTEEFYIKSREDMERMLPNICEAFDNTVVIAEKCNYEFEFGNVNLPSFIAPKGKNNSEFFNELCMQGVKRFYGQLPDQAVLDRLNYETDMIRRMGYTDYFLIVADFIRYAKEKGIPVGPGRGSGAGSLAAYCMGITGIDPIKYNLIFERFLNPERISMPDFDIDFCYERRQEVIDYVIGKYGEEHVAQIVTFGTMAARGSIRDVGRALGMSYQLVDRTSKMVPMDLFITLDKALNKNPELKAAYDSDPRIKELIDMARKVEGMPRHASTHAAGVVITKEPVKSYVPLQKNDEAIVTQYTMGTLEELGLLKMDFLGLRTLSVISHTEKMLKRNNPRFDINSIPLDDKAVFEMFSQGETTGVFQFESAGMRRVLSGLRPETFEDIIAVIALYRPGPMESIPRYIDNRHHPEKVRYRHPLLKTILQVTYGCIIYQEQVMQICRELAGYSYGRADLVRRAMSKKKADVMERERKNFVFGSNKADGSIECVGAVANGVDARIANEIFDEMESFASYAFNKSHAAAYALLAYQTAYLMRHHAREYLAALLTCTLDNVNKTIEYVSECQKHSIAVLGPDINKSYEGFIVDGEKIRFGLLAIKNLGKGIIRDILQERQKNGEYAGLGDFCKRLSGKELNKRVMESLIKSGAFDCFSESRKNLMLRYERVINDIDTSYRNNISGQINLFDAVSYDPSEEYRVDEGGDEYPSSSLLAMEKEALGMFISGHPLAEYAALKKRLKTTDISSIVNSASDHTNNSFDGTYITLLCIINKKRLKTTKNGETMAFTVLEDASGSIEMLVFPVTLREYSHIINEGNTVVVRARVSVRDDEEPKLICDQVSRAGDLITSKEFISSTGSARRRGLYIKVSSDKCEEFINAKNVLENFSGDTPWYVFFEDSRKLAVAPKRMWASINDALMTYLSDILGAGNISFVE